MHSFVNFFVTIFFLGGITYLLNGKFLEAGILLFCVLVIKAIDSEWGDENLKLRDPNGTVIAFIVLATISNMYLFYQDLQTQSFIIKATDAQKNTYINFENKILTSVEKCGELHNKAIDMQEEYRNVTDAQKREISSVCNDALLELEKTPVPDANLPNNVVLLMYDIKSDYKNIVSTITKFNYKRNNDFDRSLSIIIKNNQDLGLGNFSKVRSMLSLDNINAENLKKIKYLEY